MWGTRVAGRPRSLVAGGRRTALRLHGRWGKLVGRNRVVLGHSPRRWRVRRVVGVAGEAGGA